MMSDLFTDDIQVWAIALDGVGASWHELETLLSAEECARTAHFIRDDLRRRFVVSHAALRAILGNCLKMQPSDVPFEIEKNGKPRLTLESASNLTFNLTHSGELALVAVGHGCEIGVDIERLRPVRQLEDLARRYFARNEIDAILSVDEVDRDAAFLTTWAMKEAVLKGMGRGIGFPLDRVVVDLAANSQWVQVDEAPLARTSAWWLQRIDSIDAYIAAVATNEQRQPSRVLTYPASQLWDIARNDGAR